MRFLDLVKKQTNKQHFPYKADNENKCYHPISSRSKIMIKMTWNRVKPFLAFLQTGLWPHVQHLIPLTPCMSSPNRKAKQSNTWGSGVNVISCVEWHSILADSLGPCLRKYINYIFTLSSTMTVRPPLAKLKSGLSYLLLTSVIWCL